MNLSALFIRRSVMTSLVMAALLLMGVLGYERLPINDLPQVDFPTIVCVASLPGASPETMASAVAAPLERQFATIQGIASMNSTSALGNALITIQFDLSRDIDSAAMDVQSAITAALPLLPPMPTRPYFRKVNPADAPILYLTLSSDTRPLYVVDECAETLVAQRLSQVDGVAQVLVYGMQKYAIHVQVNPDKLAAYGIGLDQVETAIRTGSVKKPTGTFYGPHQAFNIQTNDQLTSAAAFNPLIVAVRNGKPVRIRDIGRAVDSVQNDKIASWSRHGRAVVLAVQRQPGSNTVQIIDDIRKLLPDLQAETPGGVDLQILFDRSVTIRESVRDVEITLLITVVLVVGVIFLFLRDIRATVIPSLSLPLSLFGTFAAMGVLGFSLNNLSLMALTLCVGFVVDDAIVVLENIVRHGEMGKDPWKAALDGTREVSFTVVAMTLSLVAVFIPILFMGDLMGRLFREFAVTIAVAILVSGLVALTLIPMLGSRLLKQSSDTRKSTASNALEGVFDAVRKAYETTLRFALRLRRCVLAVSVILVFLTVYVFSICAKGFIPTADTGQILCSTLAAQDISFDDMCDHQKQLMRVIEEDPDVQDILSSVGSSAGVATLNAGFILIALKPRAERTRSADQILQQLRPRLAAVAGIQAFMQNPPAIRIGGQITRGAYQVTLQSLDPETLYRAADMLADKVGSIAGVQDVSSDLQIASLQASVDIDRDKASTLGLTMSAIDQVLSDAYGAQEIATIYTPENEYYVILEVAPEYYSNPNLLKELYISTVAAAGSPPPNTLPGGQASTGKLVPLSTVARFHSGVAPLLVNHLGEIPSATISFNLSPSVSLGNVLAQVQTHLRNAIPMGVTASFQGSAQAFQQSMTNLLVLIVIAILVIYIVLGILYESYVHPITILSGLPSAGLGAMLTLMCFHRPLDIYGFLGLIMLIGIVKKNAIMMIDRALETERTEGRSCEEAIYEAALVRFRPIMMTTVAALMGCLPIAIGWGAGGDTRQPLGLAVVGGLLVSQLLTLYITPVVYIYVDHLSSWLRGFRSGRAPLPITMPATPAHAGRGTRLMR